MQSTHRFFHKNSLGVIVTQDECPTYGPNIFRQAEMVGGTFTKITKGLPKDSVANFSPSIIKARNKTLIAWRSQPEPFVFKHDGGYAYNNDAPTEIYVGELRNDKEIINATKIRTKPHRLSYEDPRLFLGPDQELYIQFIGSTYATRWQKDNKKLFDQPKVIVCWLNENLEAVSPAIPPIRDNLTIGKPEKNWCFFPYDSELRCLYSTRPLVIEREKGEAIQVNTDCLEAAVQGCPAYNSLPPLELPNGKHLIIYHWKHMAKALNGLTFLIYHLGAYTVDRDFHKVIDMTTEPILTGSLHDRLIKWTDVTGNPVSYQPACILPFGAYIENRNLVMSLGVNDAFMGIFKCPLETILARLVPV